MDGGSGSGATARTVLQPIAAPSILGLYAFAGSTLVVAGMWSYKARDAVATAMHGMWGSFWIGYGILHLLFAGEPGVSQGQ